MLFFSTRSSLRYLPPEILGLIHLVALNWKYPGCWHKGSNCERKKTEISSVMDDLTEACKIVRVTQFPARLCTFLYCRSFYFKKTAKKLVWQFTVEQHWKGLVWSRTACSDHLFCVAHALSTMMRDAFSASIISGTRLSLVLSWK